MPLHPHLYSMCPKAGVSNHIDRHTTHSQGRSTDVQSPVGARVLRFLALLGLVRLGKEVIPPRCPATSSSPSAACSRERETDAGRTANPAVSTHEALPHVMYQSVTEFHDLDSNSR